MMGAGAVGGYYGSRLAQAGHDVKFVARGAHADALRRSGLQIKSELGDVDLRPVHVVSDLQQVGSVDLVVVAVKLWDTEGAARAILPMIDASTAVVSLQNGIDKDETLAGIVGREHVLGGVTYILARLTEPGVIVHSGTPQRILIGELDGGRSSRVDDIVEALTKSRIDATASRDIRRDTWEKFAFLATNSAVTAVTRETIGVLRAHATTRALLRDAMQEVVDLARAEGIAIADDFVDERMRFIDTLPATGRASMAQDLLRGARLELEWLSGTVVRRAEKLGVHVPVHRTLYAALVLFAAGTASQTRGAPMKTMGMVGGIGPESTIDYYQSLVARYRDRVRDGSYPAIVINCVNLQRLVDGFNAGDLAGVASYLVDAVETLARAGADFGLLSANTPHIVFEEVSRRSRIPLISIVEAACDAAQAMHLERLALFGTRFTMQGRFYPEVFSRAGIALVVPQPDEQAFIHEKYMGELIPGVFTPETRAALLAIVDRLRERDGIDGVILGGTELPLLLRQDSHHGIPFLDTTRIHVERAIDELLR